MGRPVPFKMNIDGVHRESIDDLKTTSAATFVLRPRPTQYKCDMSHRCSSHVQTIFRNPHSSVLLLLLVRLTPRSPYVQASGVTGRGNAAVANNQRYPTSASAILDL